MQSRAAAMREYLPAPPKWKWLRVVTAAAPCSRARPTAHSAPCLQGRCPMPPSPSRVCAVVDSRTTLMSGAGLTLPSRIMRQYPAVCQVPWLTTPRRSVMTSSPAMVAACSALMPARSNSVCTSRRMSPAGTRMPLFGGTLPTGGFSFPLDRWPCVRAVKDFQSGAGSRSGEGFRALRRVAETS